MNTDALIAAHRAHVAAHGRDCGRGSGKSERDPCVAIYRAWLHMSTGEWQRKHPVELRIYSRALYSRSRPKPRSPYSREQRHQRYLREKELLAETRKEQRKTHEVVREKEREQNRRYYLLHKEELNARRAVNARKSRGLSLAI